MEQYVAVNKNKDSTDIDDIYNECVKYLKENSVEENDYASIKDGNEEIANGEIKNREVGKGDIANEETENIETSNEEIENGQTENVEQTNIVIKSKMFYQIENELKSNESLTFNQSEGKAGRLRKLSQQLPKIIITQSNTSLNGRQEEYKFDNDIKRANSLKHFNDSMQRNHGSKLMNHNYNGKRNGKTGNQFGNHCHYNTPRKSGYGDHPKRLVCKRGYENVALITNVPFERIRLLNDTFHTLINLRWRWIVTGTIVVHFAIWLVFAVFWYIAAWAHYDFDPNPPKKTCITGGYDFLTIFLASVEAQTTIGFGDRAIDEECPESIFLFIMQLILGTGLSGVLTCVVYAKLTRPEKLSRDGVGFSKKAVISTRDGRLCLMMRAWDLNYDHIISSEFAAHFIHTHRTKEGEIIRYYAQSLSLQQRQFLLWPVTLVHVIDNTSPLYRYGPEHIANSSYEITLSLKGASASMGTFTQSQTSYLPKEIVWGYRFPSVVTYDARKQKYVIDHKKLDLIEPVDTPYCSAEQLCTSSEKQVSCPSTPTSFSEKISSFQLGRSSSFKRKHKK